MLEEELKRRSDQLEDTNGKLINFWKKVLCFFLFRVFSVEISTPNTDWSRLSSRIGNWRLKWRRLRTSMGRTKTFRSRWANCSGSWTIGRLKNVHGQWFLRFCFSCGYDPTFGCSHLKRSRSFWKVILLMLFMIRRCKPSILANWTHCLNPMNFLQRKSWQGIPGIDLIPQIMKGGREGPIMPSVVTPITFFRYVVLNRLETADLAVITP